MVILLRDTVQPNIVQTLEHTPAIIHGGAFANIAHGCNTLFATRMALKLADYAVTEAGFGSDLGAEKFFDIKCREGGLQPSAAVIVATVRALKHHGDGSLEDGFANLAKHIENVRCFGVSPVVAINRFDGRCGRRAARRAASLRGSRAFPPLSATASTRAAPALRSSPGR